MPEIGSFVALGDSFTEGLGDPYADGDGRRGWGYRGWADRFAERLAKGNPGLRYANLAVRGKVIAEVAADQVPRAVAMAPDLVSVAAGGNDLLRPRADPDILAQAFERMIVDLRGAGCDVLLFTGFDPRTFPLIRLVRGKAAAFNMHLRGIAARHDCRLVDLWEMRVLADAREWSADRLHMSSDGHRRVALRACEVIGVAVDADWREPLPSLPGPDAVVSRSVLLSRTAAWIAARRQDAHWARVHAAPWLARQVRGVSSGDGIPPKCPELLPMSPLQSL